MYVNLSARAVYLAHPRTASHATARVLQDRCGFSKVAAPVDHHSGLYQAGPVTREDRAGWSVATAVRHHWDAVASWMARMGFGPSTTVREVAERFERNPWVRDGRLWWPHDGADVVLRYESLRDDLAAWCVRLGVDDPGDLPAVNVGARDGAHYRDVMSADVARWVGETFGDEISRYGYVY